MISPRYMWRMAADSLGPKGLASSPLRDAAPQRHSLLLPLHVAPPAPSPPPRPPLLPPQMLCLMMTTMSSSTMMTISAMMHMYMRPRFCVVSAFLSSLTPSSTWAGGREGHVQRF